MDNEIEAVNKEKDEELRVKKWPHIGLCPENTVMIHYIWIMM